MKKLCPKRNNVVLVNVMADMVCDRLNLTVAEMEDAKAVKKVKRLYSDG